MNRKLSERDISELIEAYRLGYSMGAIARGLGVSRKTVCLHLPVNEIRPPRRKMSEEEKKRRDAIHSKRYYLANKEKCAAYRKAYYEAHKLDPGGQLERSRTRYKADPQRRHLLVLAKYGLSAEAWHEMLIRQAGRCAICSSPMESPHVDHDHRTGKVRELLCNHCNRGLGEFFDSPDLLMKAAAYVKLHTETLVESVAE